MPLPFPTNAKKLQKQTWGEAVGGLKVIAGSAAATKAIQDATPQRFGGDISKLDLNHYSVLGLTDVIAVAVIAAA